MAQPEYLLECDEQLSAVKSTDAQQAADEGLTAEQNNRYRSMLRLAAAWCSSSPCFGEGLGTTTSVGS